MVILAEITRFVCLAILRDTSILDRVSQCIPLRWHKPQLFHREVFTSKIKLHATVLVTLVACSWIARQSFNLPPWNLLLSTGLSYIGYLISTRLRTTATLHEVALFILWISLTFAVSGYIQYTEKESHRQEYLPLIKRVDQLEKQIKALLETSNQFPLKEGPSLPSCKDAVKCTTIDTTRRTEFVDKSSRTRAETNRSCSWGSTAKARHNQPFNTSIPSRRSSMTHTAPARP